MPLVDAATAQATDKSAGSDRSFLIFFSTVITRLIFIGFFYF